MPRVLVLYATHHGQTRAIAVALAQRLRERGNTVELADVRDWQRLAPPEEFDAVVFGSRIEVGRHAPEMLAYIATRRAILAKLPTAFFSVSMAASKPDAGPDPEGYLAKTFAHLDWHPVLSTAFAGGLPYRRYNWMMRLVMKQIARRSGGPTDTSRDHELTDWEAVAAFADKVAYIAGGARAAAPPPHDQPRHGN